MTGKRTRNWLKIKARHEAICHIVGVQLKGGYWGDSIRALILAEMNESGLCYCGYVGSGMSNADLAIIRKRVIDLKCKSPSIPASRGHGIQWVKPELRCRIIYNERTAHGHLRAPVFKGLVAD